MSSGRFLRNRGKKILKKQKSVKNCAVAGACWIVCLEADEICCF
jgi:hypothetical protein